MSLGSFKKYQADDYLMMIALVCMYPFIDPALNPYCSIMLDLKYVLLTPVVIPA